MVISYFKLITILEYFSKFLIQFSGDFFINYTGKKGYITLVDKFGFVSNTFCFIYYINENKMEINCFSVSSRHKLLNCIQT